MTGNCGISVLADSPTTELCVRARLYHPDIVVFLVDDIVGNIVVNFLAKHF